MRVRVWLQGLLRADGVGYIIPTCIVKNFLAALETSTGPDGRAVITYPGLQVR